MGKQDIMKVSVVNVPLKGKAVKTEHEVPITVSGSTVGAIAKHAGISLDKRSLMVDGKPATIETLVKPGAKIELRVTERPQGS